MEFRNRRDGGRRLAAQLLPLAHEHPVVVALPRGGVVVGSEVARSLGVPLDVLAVRKLGATANPEFAVGAIAEDGTSVLNAASARRAGMTQAAIEVTLERELAELRRRVERYRGGLPPRDLRGRTAIVVDDGLATGLTALVAVRALRAAGAARIVVAAPVGSAEAVALVGEEADEVVCHTIPHQLIGVGRWYHDFAPVSDSEVLALLRAANPARATPLEQAGDGGEAGQAGSPAHPQTAHRAPLAGARELMLEVDGESLPGDLNVPSRARGLVIFAHGSGSGRLSARNREVAGAIGAAGFATLLFDLLTGREAQRGEFVFDIPLLARRLELVTRWALQDTATRDLPIGYFGASTGAAAALRAASETGGVVHAVVSRGGRPDLVADRLGRVMAPTLLLVGSRDPAILALNREAEALLGGPHQLTVVDGAGHLFEEPGTLALVAAHAADWFTAFLALASEPLAVVGA